jgi:hypothetical protein
LEYGSVDQKQICTVCGLRRDSSIVKKRSSSNEFLDN